MPDYFIGLDISTTGVTAIALALDGSLIVGEQFGYELQTPRLGWAEQRPSDWWDATCKTLQSLGRQIEMKNVRSVGLTGQMLGLVALDGEHEPIRPCILWNDQRSAEQCDELTQLIGRDQLHQTAGTKLLPGMILPKLRWMQQQEPSLYSKIATVLLPKDFISWRLTGCFHTDVTDASGTGLLDIKKRSWSPTIAKLLEVPLKWFPAVHESQSVVGRITESASQATGLAVGTPVVAGAGDQPAQAIGNGIVLGGDASLTIGTSGVVFVAADRYAPDPSGRWHTFCHAIPNVWCHMGVMLSAAGSLEWLKSRFFPDLRFDELDEIAFQAPAGCDGLLFAPYLSGERHPHSDPTVRGGFVGLSLSHDRSHLIRAVLEGVAFGLRDLLELAREAGCHPTSARVSGGASRSRLWMQILADSTDLPLSLMEVSHGGAVGAGILAAVGVGVIPDTASACKTFARPGSTIQPGSESAALAVAYSKFQQLYPALSTLTK